MTRIRLAALVAGAALALSGLGWIGYQQLTTAVAPAESLTGYDPSDPAQVAATADDVFTATVLSTRGRHRVDDVDWQQYEVRVHSVQKGHRSGTVRVAVEAAGPMLATDALYVFATTPFADPDNGHGQVIEAAPQPASEQTVRIWERAAHQRS
ncbi:hypothetical protein [Streptomyces sp. NPDC050264]|uniref:hypothetical protein n=1 Tax=Streptomyces sp. NPDC050264 TaxID=3155038 RepID=UPI003442A3D6